MAKCDQMQRTSQRIPRLKASSGRQVTPDKEPASRRSACTVTRKLIYRVEDRKKGSNRKSDSTRQIGSPTPSAVSHCHHFRSIIYVCLIIVSILTSILGFLKRRIILPMRNPNPDRKLGENSVKWWVVLQIKRYLSCILNMALSIKKTTRTYSSSSIIRLSTREEFSWMRVNFLFFVAVHGFFSRSRTGSSYSIRTSSETTSTNKGMLYYM